VTSERAVVVGVGEGRLTVAFDDGRDADQAVEDLGAEWRREARQRWVLDTDEVAGGDGRRRPDLARRTDAAVRVARLRAERDAVAAVAPDAEARLRVLDAQLRLERVAQPKPARALGRR
jgi:hypothetical protein